MMISMKIFSRLVLGILLVALFIPMGCGSKDSQKTVSLITDEDLDMLASLGDGLGSAQTSVEIIPVPEPPQGRVEMGSIPTEIPIEPEVLIETQEVAPSLDANVPSMVYQNDESYSFEQKVQLALKRANYYEGNIDGKVGPQTRKAIRGFQKDNNLHVDGLTGPNTWAKLKDYYYSGDSSE